ARSSSQPALLGVSLSRIGAVISRQPVHPNDQQGGQWDPEKLVPVEKWNPPERGLDGVVERHPKQRHERDDQQQVRPARPVTRVSGHGYTLCAPRASIGGRRRLPSAIISTFHNDGLDVRFPPSFATGGWLRGLKRRRACFAGAVRLCRHTLDQAQWLLWSGFTPLA